MRLREYFCIEMIFTWRVLIILPITKARRHKKKGDQRRNDSHMACAK